MCRLGQEAGKLSGVDLALTVGPGIQQCRATTVEGAVEIRHERQRFVGEDRFKTMFGLSSDGHVLRLSRVDHKIVKKLQNAKLI
jgi:hypothetical protein